MEFTDQEIRQAFKGKADIKYSVDKMKGQFSKELQAFNPTANPIPLKDYFGAGIGEVGSLERMLDQKIINEKKDIRGLYVFLHDGNPFYAGITRNLPSRIQQHVKGHNAVTATLAHRIAKKLYEEKTGKAIEKAFEGNDFKQYVGPVKKALLEEKLSFVPIHNDIEMALYEIYFATKYKTLHNEFRTH
jgi:predicted GIY-YIG superfamily endonuclease